MKTTMTARMVLEAMQAVAVDGLVYDCKTDAHTLFPGHVREIEKALSILSRKGYIDRVRIAATEHQTERLGWRVA